MNNMTLNARKYVNDYDFAKILNLVRLVFEDEEVKMKEFSKSAT